jgi:hypothetical protein
MFPTEIKMHIGSTMGLYTEITILVITEDGSSEIFLFGTVLGIARAYHRMCLYNSVAQMGVSEPTLEDLWDLFEQSTMDIKATH